MSSKLWPMVVIFNCFFIQSFAVDLITTKIEPSIRAYSVDDSLSKKVDMNKIQPFLQATFAMDSKLYNKLPKVFGIDEDRLVGYKGCKIFVFGIPKGTPVGSMFKIVTGVGNIKKTATRENIGFETHEIGTAILRKFSDKAAELEIVTAKEAIIVGVKLISNTPYSLNMDKASVPYRGGAVGKIVSGYLSSSGLSKFDAVVVDIGVREKVQDGNILGIYRAYSIGGKNNVFHEKQGEIIIYKTYEKMSLGLIIEANSAIYLQDEVKTP